MSIIIIAASRSIAAEAGTETEYGFTVTADAELKTDISQGKTLKSTKAITAATVPDNNLDSRKTVYFIFSALRYGRSWQCTAKPDQPMTKAQTNAGNAPALFRQPPVTSLSIDSTVPTDGFTGRRIR